MNSSSDEDDGKKQKKIKKKKIPKLPRKNIVIYNNDKDSGWMETWSQPRGRSPANIPHSYRLLALGGCGKGKSNVMKQIFLATLQGRHCKNVGDHALRSTRLLITY